jgi:hypothetical protein
MSHEIENLTAPEPAAEGKNKVFVPDVKIICIVEVMSHEVENLTAPEPAAEGKNNDEPQYRPQVIISRTPGPGDLGKNAEVLVNGDEIGIDW